MNPTKHNRNFSKGNNPHRQAGKWQKSTASFRNAKPSFHGRSQGNRKKFPSIDASRFVRRAEAPAETVPYRAKNTFEEFALHNAVKRNVLSRGYTIPTPIQDEAIPHVLAGRDVVGIAQTGTGKTAAFLLPLLTKILLEPEEKALIIVPTRELAMQIDEELRSFAAGLRIRAVVCIGGASIGAQISELRKPHQFIIGTPGRIKDLLQRKDLDLSNVKNLVLDEADRMLDMGFLPETKTIVAKMSAKRHTLFFSATFSPEIERLVDQFLSDPVKIAMKRGETASTVDQEVIRVPNKDKKMDTLHDLLIKEEFEKVLIFGRTKWGVEKLSRELVRRGFKSVSIHGNKTQGQRKNALTQFKMSKANILVATDVASRGLDIDNVSHVINFDAPATYEDYTHRVGRTGRAGKAGKAITFVE